MEDITYDWSRITVTGDKYGLLAKILGVNEYDHQTDISMYVAETEPASYNPSVTDLTPTHTQKRIEEECECV